MKKSSFQTADVSFDDFMAQADVQPGSGKTAIEIAAENKAAADELQKKFRALKKAKQVRKKSS